MTRVKTENHFEVLLAEDNDADILLLEEVLEEIEQDIHLQVVRNGEEALGYLQGAEPYAGSVRPDLIILDLNLPKCNGFKVLAEIKQDSELRRIPVVIFSTSQAEEDIKRSYQLNANCFITKPSQLSEFIETVKKISDFWFNVVKLPE